MADMTVTGLKTDITKAFDSYVGELKQHVPGSWEKKPGGHADGEAAWSARQVAEHVAGSSGFFAAGIARATGAIHPRAQGQFSFADPAEAASGTPGAYYSLMGVINQVTDDQLGKEVEFGPLGKTTIGNVIGIVAYHFNDHANQLKSLR